MHDDQHSRPAWTYDIGAFLRAKVRPVIQLDERTLQRLTGVCAALYDGNWTFDQVSTWALWVAKRVAANPSVKSPAAVLVKEIEKGSPKDMPTAPRRVSPGGHSPDPGFLERTRANAKAVAEASYPPILLIQGRGRFVGDYRQAMIDVQAEYERQGRPEYCDVDLAPFGEGGACEIDPLCLKDFKGVCAEQQQLRERQEAHAQRATPGTERWQDRRAREREEQDRKYGPRRHPFSISEPEPPTGDRR